MTEAETEPEIFCETDNDIKTETETETGVETMTGNPLKLRL